MIRNDDDNDNSANKSLARTVFYSSIFIMLMVISNVFEEYMYSRMPGFDYYKTIATIELLVFAVASRWLQQQNSRIAAARKANNNNKRKTPIFFYIILGVAMALSQTLGKLANKYVNFTVGTIFKCSKALPTMMISAVFLKREYDRYEVLAVVCMGVAAIFFALGASAVDSTFSVIGIVCNVLYLIFQSTQVALQDLALRDYGASVVEVMLYANSFGLVAVGSTAIFDGEIKDAFFYFIDLGPIAISILLIRTITFYVAVRFYTVIIKENGGVTAVTVGIIRKILTIVCSLVFYPKAFSRNYVYGSVLFIVALYLEANNSLRREKRANNNATKPISNSIA